MVERETHEPLAGNLENTFSIAIAGISNDTEDIDTEL